MHVWALFFFHIECGCVCVCVRLIVSPSAWKWSEMTDLAWETNTSAAGTAGSLWAAAEVLILLFGLVGNWPTSVSFSFFHPLPSLSHFLYPLQGFTLLLFFFSLFASYHFFWLKSLTLKFARKKKEDKRRVQQDVVVQIGVEEPCQLSALCLGSDNVALFEIASCKDNCASRCCNKLMTVLTLKLEEYLQWVKTDDFSSCSSVYLRKMKRLCAWVWHKALHPADCIRMLCTCTPSIMAACIGFSSHSPGVK